MVLLLLGCNSNRFDNEERSYYQNGQLKSLRLWNNNNKDEEVKTYNVNGELSELIKVLYPYRARASFKKDSVFYSFYLPYNDTFLNEYLTCLEDSKAINAESEYLFLAEQDDSVRISFIGREIISFEILQFEVNDTTLAQADTIRSYNKRSIYLPKKSLTDKKFLCNIKYSFDSTSQINTIVMRQIYLNCRIKKEFQDFFNLEQICTNEVISLCPH